MASLTLSLSLTLALAIYITWVAMPAWSVPGSHSVGRPRIRWKRAMMSW